MVGSCVVGLKLVGGWRRVRRASARWKRRSVDEEEEEDVEEEVVDREGCVVLVLVLVTVTVFVLAGSVSLSDRGTPGRSGRGRFDISARGFETVCLLTVGSEALALPYERARFTVLFLFLTPSVGALIPLSIL
jgi:hypothetical protein